MQLINPPFGAWIIRERIHRARELLEQRRDLSVDVVADLSGFGSSETLRLHFRNQLGTTPAGYRQRFAL